MSLIQEALEKTARLQTNSTIAESKTEHFVQPWTREIMGEELERELSGIQRHYFWRRTFVWRFGAGVLLLLAVGAFSYMIGNHGGKTVPAKNISPASSLTVSQPPTIYRSFTPYRLTGITSFDSKPMAVINDEIVGVGDALSGRAVVKEILDGQVLLDVRGKETKLTL